MLRQKVGSECTTATLTSVVWMHLCQKMTFFAIRPVWSRRIWDGIMPGKRPEWQRVSDPRMYFLFLHSHGLTLRVFCGFQSDMCPNDKSHGLTYLARKMALCFVIFHLQRIDAKSFGMTFYQKQPRVAKSRRDLFLSTNDPVVLIFTPWSVLLLYFYHVPFYI